MLSAESIVAYYPAPTPVAVRPVLRLGPGRPRSPREVRVVLLPAVQQSPSRQRPQGCGAARSDSLVELPTAVVAEGGLLAVGLAAAVDVLAALLELRRLLALRALGIEDIALLILWSNQIKIRLRQCIMAK